MSFLLLRRKRALARLYELEVINYIWFFLSNNLNKLHLWQTKYLGLNPTSQIARAKHARAKRRMMSKQAENSKNREEDQGRGSLIHLNRGR